MCFVLAFGSDTGVAVLVERISAQLAQLEVVQQSGITVSVSYQCLRQVPSEKSALTEMSVRTTAASIAAFINAKSYPRYARQ